MDKRSPNSKELILRSLLESKEQLQKLNQEDNALQKQPGQIDELRKSGNRLNEENNQLSSRVEKLLKLATIQNRIKKLLS